jgi:hypothetical protein
MMNQELIPKSATTWQMYELPSSPPLLLLKAHAMNVHASSTGLVLRDEFAGKHVVVVVKYVQEATGQRGYVGTMYLSRAVYSRGVLVWPRSERISQ